MARGTVLAIVVGFIAISGIAYYLINGGLAEISGGSVAVTKKSVEEIFLHGKNTADLSSKISGTKKAGSVLPSPKNSPAISDSAESRLEATPVAPCLVENGGLPSRRVLINEVAWAGTESGKASHEWIELKNATDTKTGLSGWQLVNKTASLKVFFGGGEALQPSGYYLLERGSEETVPSVSADKIYANAVKNSDEFLRLFDDKCNLVDEVFANPDWPAGTASPDYRSAERSENFSWHTYSGNGSTGSPKVFGTPRAKNSEVSQNFPISSVSQKIPGVFYGIQFLKEGSGRGSVSSSPSGISCSENCFEDSEDYPAGTALRLSAVPKDGSYFWGWSGACSGVGACELKVDENKNVSAIFNLISPPGGVSVPAQSGGSARSNGNHILVSQVQITGGSGATANDFIEIYNPFSEQFNLKGYRLVKRTQTGTSDYSIKSWTSDAIIPAYGFYLWANTAYAAVARTPDASTTATIADNNGVAIRFGAEDTGEIVDSLGWGSAQNVFVEGNVFATNPGPNQSLARKTWSGNCVPASLDRSAGNGCDTGNNVQDFEIMENSNPRNSQY